MEHADGFGETQRPVDTSSAERAGTTAVVVGGLLLAGFAVSHVLKSSMRERAPDRTNGGRHDGSYELEEPPPDPELGAWG